MLKKISLFVLALLFIINVNAQPFQGASQAPNGTGRYKKQIYWINWDSNNNGYPDETINSAQGTQVVRTVDVPGGITFTITLTQNTGSSTLSSYVPGKWDWDDLKSGYNWFKNGTAPYNYRYYYDNTSTAVAGVDKYDYSGGTGWARAYNSLTDAHNSVIGLINKDQYSSATFNMTISGVYTGTSTPIPASLLQGFIFAGAESLQGNGSATFDANKENYQITNKSNSYAWRVIDTVLNKVPSGYAYYGAYSWAGYATAGFTEVANVTNAGTQIQLYNGSTSTPPAAPTSPARPPGANTTAVYFEGSGDVVWMADRATNVDINFKGNGYTAIAVGFVYATDLGDAPSNYGSNVASIQNVNFSGGVLPNGAGKYIKDYALATKNASTLMIGKLVDDESSQLYSANFKGDDNDSLSDEDGLTATGAVANFVVGSAAQSIKVPVVNNSSSAATLMGWIDINRNNQFDANEMASVAVAANSGSTTATLTWTLPQVFNSSTSYALRLRLYDVNNTTVTDNGATTVDERAINGMGFGETEDHQVIVNVILPVKLQTFNIRSVACTIQINWTSATEQNFNRYEIERSADGKQYNSIARFTGKGDNSQYSYTDATAPSGKAFYRLKMVDWDGKIEYSLVQVVNINCDNTISIKPTVTTSTTWLQGLKEGQVVYVYSSIGQLVYKLNASSQNQQLDLGRMASGIYRVLVAQNGKAVFVGSVVKQ